MDGRRSCQATEEAEENGRKMEDLAIGGCGDITTLSNQAGFQHLSSLQKLQIYGCSVLLENLPHELHKPSSLTFLEFEGCPSLYGIANYAYTYHY
ncbi:hypothetical protein POPTR_003G195450v4 [Populus trichocarpa]|uniref:Uncharacterized protein n=1 Tax=Populus trichocarpa TaxID=3694 RepID=A0ACC0TAY8_POPTR|nr:hypothetical protein BDE02_03G179500 [Populus trichocarpa]KAI9398548.1 hypothetical protein POPTR_003G195450v4 [Populus trichocarpa]